MERALSAVRVIDLSQCIAGPYCTRLLAGFGADVVKVEKPGEGDMARRMGPFLGDDPGPERSGLFLYLNGNKRGITLNLKSQAGVKGLKELVRDADVLVESFRPGTMARFGLDYETLEKINPRLVVTSISNFGQDGPYRDWKTSHLINWSMSGGRYSDGEPGKKPLQGGGWLTHSFTGLHALVGTCGALFQRNETGSGQQIDVSMLESTILTTIYTAVIYSYLGLFHNNVCRPYLGICRCKDGYVGVNVFTQSHWNMLCSFFGMPALTEDPRFANIALVNENKEVAKELFAPQLMERTGAELFESGAEWRIPFALVPATTDILASPQHLARGFFDEVEHPVVGKVTVPGAPFKLTGSPWRHERAAPLLGEHNEEIWCGRLGYAKADLARLRAQGVI
jgi:CoA:oxalate CoA-transferase